MDMNLSKLWEMVKDKEAWGAGVHRIPRVGHDLETEWQHDKYDVLEKMEV